MRLFLVFICDSNLVTIPASPASLILRSFFSFTCGIGKTAEEERIEMLLGRAGWYNCDDAMCNQVLEIASSSIIIFALQAVVGILDTRAQAKEGHGDNIRSSSEPMIPNLSLYDQRTVLVSSHSVLKARARTQGSSHALPSLKIEMVHFYSAFLAVKICKLKNMQKIPGLVALTVH